MSRFRDQKKESEMLGTSKEPTRKYRLIGGGNHGLNLKSGRVTFTRGDEFELTKAQAKKLNDDAFPVKRVERVKHAKADKPASVPAVPTKAPVREELTADEELLTGNVATVVKALKEITDEVRLGKLFDLEASKGNRSTVTTAITAQIMSDSQASEEGEEEWHTPSDGRWRSRGRARGVAGAGR